MLRLLLEERVSIRNLPLILEAIAEARPAHASAEAVCEHVRQRLGFQLVADMRRADGTLPLIQLAPEWEERFAATRSNATAGARMSPCPPTNSPSRLANAHMPTRLSTRRPAQGTRFPRWFVTYDAAPALPDAR